MAMIQSLVIPGSKFQSLVIPGSKFQSHLVIPLSKFQPGSKFLPVRTVRSDLVMICGHGSHVPFLIKSQHTVLNLKIVKPLLSKAFSSIGNGMKPVVTTVIPFIVDKKVFWNFVGAVAILAVFLLKKHAKWCYSQLLIEEAKKTETLTIPKQGEVAVPEQEVAVPEQGQRAVGQVEGAVLFGSAGCSVHPCTCLPPMYEVYLMMKVIIKYTTSKKSSI